MRKLSAKQAICFFLLITCFSLSAQKPAKAVNNDAIQKQAQLDIQQKYDQYKKIALQIWDYSEVSFKESKSSSLLQKTLLDEGFKVDSGVAGMPTAFIASYGSGKPVIGILAEFDALPGLSQTINPERKIIEGKQAGHGCGHHLFGTASVAAAIEIKHLMAENKFKGTIQLFGTPAEEDGSGKVYMARDGLLKDVDVMLEWHPGASNAVHYGSTLAIVSAKFRFHGLSAHAAAAPDKGRSALDGVESFDYMANMMREHIPQDARVHYVITKGGKAPNVVPDFAEVYYFIRHNNKDMVQQIFSRLIEAAKGAAMGTGTTMDYEITDGEYEILPNKTLSLLMHQNLKKVGGVNYTEEEIAFAKKIQSSFTYVFPPIAMAATVDTFNDKLQLGMASSDVGDVSWNVPTVGLSTATWVPGTPAHSWQAVACGGTDIGIKGMMVAAKTLSLTAIDLFTQPAIIEKATIEFKKARGENFVYKSLVGDRKPPLDIRD